PSARRCRRKRASKRRSISSRRPWMRPGPVRGAFPSPPEPTTARREARRPSPQRPEGNRAVHICLVGAGGGIGRQLLKTFSAGHRVSAVYRTMPAHPPPDVETVRFADEAELARAVGEAEVVVHAALNTRDRGKAFTTSNRAVTEKLLSLLRPGRCRLFVYFSSQVVYSALDAKRHKVQGEDDALAERPGLDAYTRLKLVEEARVVAAC